MERGSGLDKMIFRSATKNLEEFVSYSLWGGGEETYGREHGGVGDPAERGVVRCRGGDAGVRAGDSGAVKERVKRPATYSP